MNPVAVMETDEGFRISRRRMMNRHTGHVHGFYEILYLVSGERWLFINDRTFGLREGNLILIRPDVLHRAVSEGPADCEGILLYVREDFLPPTGPVRDVLKILLAGESAFFTLSAGERETAENLFTAMLSEYRDRGIGCAASLQAYTLQLFVFLCRRTNAGSDQFAGHPSPLHEKVSRIVRHINAGFRGDLSLGSLASQFYLSPAYLSRVFRRITGFTLVEFVNHVRVREASRLLVETRMKAAEISGAVGFGSITHFGRVFRQIMGKSPTRYRRMKD